MLSDTYLEPLMVPTDPHLTHPFASTWQTKFRGGSRGASTGCHGRHRHGLLRAWERKRRLRLD